MCKQKWPNFSNIWNCQKDVCLLKTTGFKLKLKWIISIGHKIYFAHRERNLQTESLFWVNTHFMEAVGFQIVRVSLLKKQNNVYSQPFSYVIHKHKFCPNQSCSSTKRYTQNIELNFSVVTVIALCVLLKNWTEFFEMHMCQFGP